jgi:DNA adenine methylase
MSNLNNKSPLRYPGGKTRACKVLDNVINSYFNIENIDTVISPFFGGGSFEFYLQNKYNWKIIGNDKFQPLYNFWNACKNNNIELCNSLYQYTTISKNDFNNFRSKIMTNLDPLIQSIHYFIINRCSFSGATLSGGFSEEASKKRFTKSSIDKIANLSLDKFNIYNLDFKDFIESYYDASDKALLFLDPPYYLEKNSKLYGNKGDMHENFDHIGLHQVLSNKTNWILTYNDSPYIRELYNDFIILDTKWSYGMNTSKKSSEIIIISN